VTISPSGGTGAVTINASGGGSALPTVKNSIWVQPSSSSASSITTGSMTVASGDFVVIACGGGQTNVTGITASDALSNSWTALTFQENRTNGNAQLQVSWSSITNGGSDTFTCTPSTSSTYLGMSVIDFSATSGSLNTSAVNTQSTLTELGSTDQFYTRSGEFTTSGPTIDVFCNVFGEEGGNEQLPWFVSGAIGIVTGLGASYFQASTYNSPVCEYAIIPYAVTDTYAGILVNAGSGNSTANSLLAINY